MKVEIAISGRVAVYDADSVEVEVRIGPTVAAKIDASYGPEASASVARAVGDAVAVELERVLRRAGLDTMAAPAPARGAEGGESERCDECGAALARAIGADVAAVLCPVCDHDRLMELGAD